VYLDPGKEGHDGECRVEDDLPVAEELKVGILCWVMEELVEHTVNGHRSVDVEGDAAD